MPGDMIGNHIQEAKRRAEVFSQVLKDAREQEAQAQQSLDEEKFKWTQSFADKSAIIEQLERELTTTVMSLDRERLKSEALLASRVEPPSVKAATQKLNDSVNTTIPVGPKCATNRGDLDNSMDRISTEENVLAGYLKESKQQTATTYRLDLENRRLSKERDSWRDACKDFEEKLNFRSSQIAEYEAERERLLKVESDTRRYVETLESKVILLKSELEIVQVELKAVLLRALSGTKMATSAYESSASPDPPGTERDVVTDVVEVLNRKIERLEREKEDSKSEYQILQLLYKNVQNERDLLSAERHEQQFGVDMPGRISAANVKEMNSSDTPPRKSAGLPEEDANAPEDKWLAAPLWNSSEKAHRSSVEDNEDKMTYMRLNQRASHYGGLEPSQPWETSPSSGYGDSDYHYADSHRTRGTDLQFRCISNEPSDTLSARRTSLRNTRKSFSRSASSSRSRSSSVDKRDRYTALELTPQLNQNRRGSSGGSDSIDVGQATTSSGVADIVSSAAKAKIRSTADCSGDIKNAFTSTTSSATAGPTSLTITAGCGTKKGEKKSKVTTPSRLRSAPTRPSPSADPTALSLQCRRSLAPQSPSQPRKKMQPQPQSSREITSARLPTAVTSLSIVRSSTSYSIKDTCFGESSEVSGSSPSTTLPTPIASKAKSVSPTAASSTARRKNDGPTVVSQKQKQITVPGSPSVNLQHSSSSSKKIFAATRSPAGARVKLSRKKSSTTKTSQSSELKLSQAQECGVEEDVVSLRSQSRRLTDAVVATADPDEVAVEEAGRRGSSPALTGSREQLFRHVPTLIDDSIAEGIKGAGSSNVCSANDAVPRARLEAPPLKKLQHSHIHKHTHIHTRLPPDQLVPNLHHPLREAKNATTSTKTVPPVAESQRRSATLRAPTRIRSKKVYL